MAITTSKESQIEPGIMEEEEIDLIDEPAIELTLPHEAAGQRLDKSLAKALSQFSRSRIQQWIEEGLVTVEGQIAKTRTTVYGGESVTVQPQPAPEDSAYEPEDIPLPIVYEDAHIIVINKPVGMVVHPAAGNWSGTLLNGLLHHHPPIAGIPRAGIVHRLDKDTSGLLVVAKTLEAQTNLVRQLQAHTVSREYLALVWGTPILRGIINAAIARHPRDRIKMAVSESMRAKPAVTHFERLATGTLDRHTVSLIRCRLETGRTHQIRVHMQSNGHPLVGDTTYGKPHLASFFHRQALHAARLGLIHPASGEYYEWEAPLPEDFAELLERTSIEMPEST